MISFDFIFRAKERFQILEGSLSHSRYVSFIQYNYYSKMEVSLLFNNLKKVAIIKDICFHVAVQKSFRDQKKEREDPLQSDLSHSC